MKKETSELKKICASPLHDGRIRALFLLAAFSVFTLGLGFILGYDFFEPLIAIVSDPLRIIIGVLYVFFALAIVHIIMSYHHMKRKQVLVCRHCGHKSSVK